MCTYKKANGKMDMEKIINEAFDEAIVEVWNDDDYFDIGYNNGLEEGRRIAISLLKEQEEFEARLDEQDDEEDTAVDNVFEAFRTCISDGKCNNHDCPYESRCNICNNQSQYLQIPKHLALDVVNKLKHQDEEIAKLRGFINGFSRDAVPVVRCKNCQREEICCRQRPDDPNWYCADGISKEN